MFGNFKKSILIKFGQSLILKTFFFSMLGEANNFPLKMIGMVAVAIALPPPSVNELRLESDMFVMRLGLDFKIVHCEPR